MMQYRKLPGHLRGIVHGASVWIGDGHLLSVRSTRFREEYKRFYMRDIQAIAVARKPRFHIGTRHLAIAAIWFFAYFLLLRFDWGAPVYWSGWAVFVLAWVYISAACSCSCRIYTAVSRDNLPSVYRTWTARRFLAAVAPRVAEVQGVIEGNWTEIAAEGLGSASASSSTPHPESPGVSGSLASAPSWSRPPRLHSASSAAPSPAPAPVPEPLPRRAAVRAVPLTYVYVASLFADAAASGLWLHSQSRAVFWMAYAIASLGIASGVMILIQYHRGLVQRAIQRLAVAGLMAAGILFYLQQVVTGLKFQDSSPALTAVGARGSLPLLWTGIATDIVLGLCGLAILLRREDDR